MTVDIRPEGRFANALAAAMRDQKIEIRELASKLGTSYEHIRKLVKGVAFPSRWLLKEICDELSLDYSNTEQMVVADRIENKWGGIPHQLVGKHPELSLLAPMWDALTDDQKDMVKSTVRNFAVQNHRKHEHAESRIA